MASIQGDFHWLNAHGDELAEKYAGKWIAVHDEKIVGIGDTAVEADEQARNQCPEGDYVLEAIDAATDAIYGSL